MSLLFVMAAGHAFTQLRPQTPKAKQASSKTLPLPREEKCAAMLEEHRKWLGYLAAPLGTASNTRAISASRATDIISGLRFEVAVTLSSGKTEKFVFAPSRGQAQPLSILAQQWDMFRANIGETSGQRLRAISLMRVVGGCKFEGANLQLANLDDFGEVKPDFRNALMTGVSLRQGKFYWGSFAGAHLPFSDLRGSEFIGCDLSGADLSGATLSDATLGQDTSLRGANLAFADLSGAFFEPSDVTNVVLFKTAGLDKVRFVVPTAVISLRQQCKEAGLNTEARELTAALFKGSLAELPPYSRFFSNYLQGGRLTNYGVDPWNAVLMLLALIPVFACIYAVALFGKQTSGICVVHFVDGALEKTQRQLRIKCRRPSLNSKSRYQSAMALGKQASLLVRLPLYFSVLTAFQIGYHDFNIGNWISRLQARPYILKPLGWVRSVAGLQALLSVYFLAIWAITFFGNPFE